MRFSRLQLSKQNDVAKKLHCCLVMCTVFLHLEWYHVWAHENTKHWQRLCAYYVFLHLSCCPLWVYDQTKLRQRLYAYIHTYSYVCIQVQELKGARLSLFRSRTHPRSLPTAAELTRSWWTYLLGLLNCLLSWSHSPFGVLARRPRGLVRAPPWWPAMSVEMLFGHAPVLACL